MIFNFRNNIFIVFEGFIIKIMKGFILSFLVLYCVAAQQSDLFNLVLHSQERGGACLDGSPPGLYIH